MRWLFNIAIYLVGLVGLQAQPLQLDVLLSKDSLYGRSILFENNELWVTASEIYANNLYPNRFYHLNLNGNIQDSSHFSPPPGISIASLVRVGDSIYLVGHSSDRKKIHLLSYHHNGSPPTSSAIIDYGIGVNVYGYKPDLNGNLLLYGFADSNYTGTATRSYPYVTTFNPILRSIHHRFFFERGQHSGAGWLFGLEVLRDGHFLMSCEGCKKYNHPLGGPANSNGYADIALFDANFNLVGDTTPVVQYWAGFPFVGTLPRYVGPERIAGLVELPDGSFVFLGIIADDQQAQHLRRDIVIAKWDRNFNKLKQTYFGTTDATDYFHHKQYLVAGYDGFLYSCVYTHHLDSMFGYSTKRQQLLISKFDTALNLIGETTFDTGDRMEFGDMISTPYGVYILTSHINTQQQAFGNTTLVRIQGSGWAVPVPRESVLFEVKLYPNPSEGISWIQSPVDLSGYKLYDMSGKLLIEKQVEPEHRIKIETDLLAPGIYIVQPLAAEPGKMMEMKRLVKY